jgi:hypothetical protein
MFHSILAAVDGSAPSAAALAVAAGIAPRQRAELTALAGDRSRRAVEALTARPAGGR